jgi:hypothetical protein
MQEKEKKKKITKKGINFLKNNKKKIKGKKLKNNKK